MAGELKISAEESIAWFIAGEVGGEGAEPTEAMHGQAKELIDWLKLDGFEVWRAGDRTSPTREQVERILNLMCPIKHEGQTRRDFIETWAAQWMALFSGQSPTEKDASDE